MYMKLIKDLISRKSWGKYFKNHQLCIKETTMFNLLQA